MGGCGSKGTRCGTCAGKFQVSRVEGMGMAPVYERVISQLPVVNDDGTPREKSDMDSDHVTRWPPDNYGPALDWEESDLVANMPVHIRSDFVRKVYSVLTVQTILSALIALPLVKFVDEAWLKEHIELYYMASIGSLTLFIASACCCQETLRNFPANYSFLLAFTVLTGICIGFVSVMHSLPCVAISAGSTAAIFLGLTAYASVTGTDFTGLGPYLFATFLGLMVVGLVLIFVDWGMGQRIYGGIGAVIFCFYIIYDTQRVMGGAHRQYQFSADDYVFAALNLYLDVLNLFRFVDMCGRSH
mmetsp:Transcript_44804/g.100620  ORF Transcript_44804/g.100620 Transcript_44804/m.100620 type:complete len:301 (+) Transcript_44804:76-978(+)